MFCADAAIKALKGAVVVLPAVAYANVGELALDVLVTSLQPQSLGPVESANVLPAVGNDAFDAAAPGVLSTALELFGVEGQPLVFLQQRAPAMLGRQAAFAAELVGWLRGAGVTAVVLLTGLDAQLRRDRQLDSSPFRFLASNDELRSLCAGSTSTAAPPSSSSPPLPPPLPLAELEADIREEELHLHHSLPPWPLVQECTAHGLPYVVLGCFASEGDNAGEGVQLAAHAVGLLRSMRAGAGSEPGLLGSATALRTPRSWVGLYGRSYPAEIF